MKKINVIGLVFGTLFGGLVAAANLHEYDTIHTMLSLEEFDVFWLMGSAIGVAAPVLWLLERRGTRTHLGGTLTLSRSRPERRHVVGGALFGLGWAVAGTCPAPALVMLSSGAGLGIVAIAGIFLGLRIRERQVRTDLHVGDGEHRIIDITADVSSTECVSV